MTENILKQKIEIFLLPLLGEIMTMATIRVQCEKIGVAPEDLTVMHLSQLAQKIENALIIFIGTEKAKKVSADIQKITL